MGLTWHRTRRQLHPTDLPGEPTVADVVHQLQDLTRDLGVQVNRLERANERVKQSTKGVS